jgi:Domain of unknown function (DUF4340)
MTPRRLIPYAVVFLVLAAVFFGLRWHREQKQAQEKQAKEVFNFKAADISAVSLKRGVKEIQLARQGAAWEIVTPMKAKADTTTVKNLVKALAHLNRERDLGTGDLKSFGLDQPALVISFTAKGKQHQLSLGQPVPGNRGVYARKDKASNILILSSGYRYPLDKKLVDLRDKTLLAFNPDQVKSLKIRTGQTQVDLERSGPHAWRWTGKPDFRVDSEKVDSLLRQLHIARIENFAVAPPKDLKAAGLAPQAQTEVDLTTSKGQEALLLGSAVGATVYARQGAQGEVVLVNKALPEQITRVANNLEDRHLWSGAVAGVHKATWGPPDKMWTAVKEKDTWKVTGPDKVELKQPAHLEVVLYMLRSLEYSQLLPQTGPSVRPGFVMELQDQAGKPLFHLENLGKKGNTGVDISIKTGKTTLTAVIPQKNYDRWQAEVNRITAPPPKPKK